MKLFLRRFVLFLIPLLLANVPAYRMVFDSTYGAYKPPQNISRFKRFLLADSHGQVIENALEPYGICNLSSNSDNYADAYRKVAYLVRNGYDVKTVYLTADAHTLSAYRDDAANFYMSLYYYGDYNSYRHSAPHADPFTFAYAKWFRPYLPLLQTDNAYFINNYFMRRLKKVSVAKPVSWDNVVDKDSLTKARVENQFRGGAKSAELKQRLEDVIELCRDYNIETVGLMFPVTQLYLEHLDTLSCHADSVFLKYGLRVVNMQESFATQDVYFKDQDHLNENGARIFAAQFADSVSTPISNHR